MPICQESDEELFAVPLQATRQFLGCARMMSQRAPFAASAAQRFGIGLMGCLLDDIPKVSIHAFLKNRALYVFLCFLILQMIQPWTEIIEKS